MSTFLSNFPFGLNAGIAVGVSAIAVFSTIGLAVHRLIFSELAGFPGPKIAALTGWYEFYFDCWRNGKYIFEIEKMHQKYGS